MTRCCALKVGEYAHARGAKRVLVITDATLVRVGLVEPIRAALNLNRNPLNVERNTEQQLINYLGLKHRHVKRPQVHRESITLLSNRNEEQIVGFSKVLTRGKEPRINFQSIMVKRCAKKPSKANCWIDVHSVVFDPTGRRCLTRGAEYKLWDVASGRMLVEYEECRPSCFSPNGNLVAGADASIFGAKIWDALTGKELYRMTGHADSISCLTFSPDGRHIATGSWDTTVKIWEIPSASG